MRLKNFHANFFPKNQRGWIRIIEVFVAILLIMGVVLLIINNVYIGKKDLSVGINKNELSILREIELNNTLRAGILATVSLPIEWSEFDSSGVGDVKDKITEKTPNDLECEAKICEINDGCLLDTTLEKDIYAKSIIILANSEIYNPRQLKLFCWESSPTSWIPEGLYNYYHKNSLGEDVAGFNSEGHITLMGACVSGGSCDNPPEDSFIMKGPSGNVAYIDSDGNICLSSGDCSAKSTDCNSPVGESFIIKNDGANVIYIDSTGDLCLTGILTENGNP